MPARDHVYLRQLPNTLSLLRLAAVPVFVGLVVAAHGRTLVAGSLFLAAAATDYLDGVIARRAGVMSQFGKVVDPLADRLLVGSAAVLLAAYDDRMPWWGAAAVLARDTVAMTGFAIVRRRVLPDVTFLGKLGTALMMAGLAGLLLLPEHDTWPLLLFWSGIALSAAAFVQYAVRYRWVLRGDRPTTPHERVDPHSHAGFGASGSGIYSTAEEPSPPPARDGARGEEESSGAPS